MMIRQTDGAQHGLRGELDRLFTRFFETAPEFPFSVLGTRGFPAVNVWDEGEFLVAEFEVAGLSMDEVEVLATPDELTVKGERAETPEEGRVVHRRERPSGKFARVVPLPIPIDPSKVQAMLKNGVLTVRLGKSKEVLPRKVEVKG